MSVTVRVALRVRPLSEKEKKENNHSNNFLTFVSQQPQQIRIDQDRRTFTFDYVYPPHISQEEVYQSCIQSLFEQYTKGCNATILAYGQTGSGKTYSMGTAGHTDSIHSDSGIIPRFAENLFAWIENQQNNTAYQVKVSFLELYNEDIIDLLNPKEMNSVISIREDANGHISWSGVHEKPVQKSTDLLNCLFQGSVSRTTASTDMNSNSSRSHAIFTVTLIQHISTTFNDQVIHKKLESKFHFVDLAGSERLKKTNAVGERAKEGISINSGLLALGNVISALGDESKRQQQHVPYRNSKLTRLLQDSLGGNSQTLMLACVSPAESNANETLSTLKYANRAKNITNTVIINQEQSLTDALKEEIMRLREEIQINDAFVKEVHVELDDLRAKNIALQTALNSHGVSVPIMDTPPKLLLKPPASKKKEDDEVTLIGSIGDDDNSMMRALPKQMIKSTSTKRKRKNGNSDKKKSNVEGKGDNAFLLTLEKHKNRLKKEALFVKQIKADSNISSDPVIFAKMVSMFQSSIKEQKQLFHYLEQTAHKQEANKKMPTSADKKKPSKPSMIKQPTTFTSTVVETQADTQLLTVEIQVLSDKLKQIVSTIKKAIVLTNNPATPLSQIKTLLNKAATIHNTNSTSNSSAGSNTSKVSKVNLPTRKSITVGKRINIEEIRTEIQSVIAIDHIKSHPICLEMMKALKQEKIKLMREQKDLLKERNAMLKEFYKDEYEQQQQMQQYMDERIDMITVQVDLITERIKLLSASSIPSIINKNNQSLIDILKPLKEGDLRALILLMIQQDLVTFNIQSQLQHQTAQTLEKFQQGIVQLRRTSKVMNNQILVDLLRSPVRCLSNGLLLISWK
ncbi:P-loop containing nucleoside triphosphate hydrolase protein [Gilbertella persicaria]|uniref:P-loop containing nucleoside triphosphate hydrolase protein n=1 Tax=Gilbertella persicaria TaxID=101096 RepID=UPI00221E8AA7|nr:P-loop containing nucleoside triphosphate hydrolase protein [Gilbertella persicaria]KAI8091428.1 P-loop containing nucleoside triphosphate hydrolase protein [Gilbertella persicaria]